MHLQRCVVTLPSKVPEHAADVFIYSCLCDFQEHFLMCLSVFLQQDRPCPRCDNGHVSENKGLGKREQPFGDKQRLLAELNKPGRKAHSFILVRSFFWPSETLSS